MELTKPVIRATEEQIKPWADRRKMYPPLDGGPPEFPRISGKEFPRRPLGRCLGHMIAFLPEDQQRAYIDYIRATDDPDFVLYSESDLNTISQHRQRVMLAGSAYSAVEKNIADVMFKRAIRRTGCGYKFWMDPFLPIEFNGEAENYFCSRCGVLQGIQVVISNPFIQEIITWRKENLRV